MNSKDIRNLCEAYIAVYDEDLRDELETYSLDEDLSFIDDLSDNELTQIMEEILIEGEYTLDECLDIFEGEYLSEAESPVRARKREARQAERKAQFQKATRPARARGRLAMQRLGQAASRAAENIKGKASKAKTLAGGAVSAAADVKRAAQRKVTAASEKIQRGKERVKGFLGRVGKAYSAAKKELSGETGRQSKLRKDFRSTVRSARGRAAAERAKDTSEFERKPASKPSDPWAGSATTSKPRPRVTTSSTKVLSGSPERKALPAGKESDRMSAAKQRLAKAAAGSRSKGIRFATSGGQVAPQRAHTGVKSALERFRKKAGITQEDFEFILDSIFEDMINEGYAIDLEEALEILESLSEFELDDLMESYLEDEEVETLDFYDVVVEHLIDEGYADDVESAEVIMVNMSEEWRDEILEGSMKAPKAGDPIPYNIRSQIQREQDPESPENKERAERRRKRGQMHPVEYK